MSEVELDLVFAPDEDTTELFKRRYGLGDGVAMLESDAGAVQLQLRAKTQTSTSGLTLTAAGQEIAAVLPYVTALAAPLAAALGAWLKERYGRKVRVKVGDVEIEASTAEEVTNLLDRAQTFKQATEPKRIYEG